MQIYLRRISIYSFTGIIQKGQFLSCWKSPAQSAIYIYMVDLHEIGRATIYILRPILCFAIFDLMHRQFHRSICSEFTINKNGLRMGKNAPNLSRDCNAWKHFASTVDRNICKPDGDVNLRSPFVVFTERY